MTPTVHVPAMLSFEYGGQCVTRPVQLIGIDEEPRRASRAISASYLQHPENREKFSFDLPRGRIRYGRSSGDAGPGAGRAPANGGSRLALATASGR